MQSLPSAGKHTSIKDARTNTSMDIGETADHAGLSFDFVSVKVESIPMISDIRMKLEPDTGPAGGYLQKPASEFDPGELTMQTCKIKVEPWEFATHGHKSQGHTRAKSNKTSLPDQFELDVVTKNVQKPLIELDPSLDLHAGKVQSRQVSICSKRSRYEDVLLRHIETMHCNWRPLDCCHCFEPLLSIDEVIEHMRAHGFRRLHSCCNCGSDFEDIADIQRKLHSLCYYCIPLFVFVKISSTFLSKSTQADMKEDKIHLDNFFNTRIAKLIQQTHSNKLQLVQFHNCLPCCMIYNTMCDSLRNHIDARYFQVRSHGCSQCREPLASFPEVLIHQLLHRTDHLHRCFKCRHHFRTDEETTYSLDLFWQECIPLYDVLKKLTALPENDMLKKLTPRPENDVLKKLTPRPENDMLKKLTPRPENDMLKKLTPRPENDVLKKLTPRPENDMLISDKLPNKLNFKILLENNMAETSDTDIVTNDGMSEIVDTYVANPPLIAVKSKYVTVDSTNEPSPRHTYSTKCYKNALLRSHYNCSLCDFVNQCIIEMRKHLVTHCDSRPLVCYHCADSLTTRDDIIAHQQKHESDFIHRCRVCSFHFTSFAQVDRTFPLYCQECLPLFRITQVQTLGAKSHDKSRQEVNIDYVLPIGDDLIAIPPVYSFARQTPEPRRVPPKISQHRCCYCCELFSNRNFLSAHMDTCALRNIKRKPAPGTECRYRCVACLECFDTRSGIELHVKKHKKDPLPQPETDVI